MQCYMFMISMKVVVVVLSMVRMQLMVGSRLRGCFRIWLVVEGLGMSILGEVTVLNMREQQVLDTQEQLDTREQQGLSTRLEHMNGHYDSHESYNLLVQNC